MEDGKSWRHEGGKFRSKSLGQNQSLQQPFLGGKSGHGDGSPDMENQRHEVDEKPQELSTWGGEFAKSMVYGGLDAIVTSFALVASVSGGNLPSAAVLVLGFANLVADGISMGFGDFLSSTTERDYMISRKRLAEWEVRNNRHTQMLDLVRVYEEHGMEKEDAEKVVDVFAKYKNLLVDQKMTLKEGLQPDEDESPWKNGIVTFISFLLFGCTPLLTYLIAIPLTENPHYRFAAACVVTGIALILLGVAKAKISGQGYVTSALVVLCNGGLAAAAAYLIGYVLTNVFGIDEG